MTIRRDYTNGQGYVCPTENTAVYNMDKPPERLVAVKPYKTALHEQDLKRLDRPTPMQRLAQIAEQEERVAKRDEEQLKKARQLWTALTGIAAMLDFSITKLEMKAKGSPARYYKDDKTAGLEKR